MVSKNLIQEQKDTQIEIFFDNLNSIRSAEKYHHKWWNYNLHMIQTRDNPTLHTIRKKVNWDWKQCWSFFFFFFSILRASWLNGDLRIKWSIEIILSPNQVLRIKRRSDLWKNNKNWILHEDNTPAHVAFL